MVLMVEWWALRCCREMLTRPRCTPVRSSQFPPLGMSCRAVYYVDRWWWANDGDSIHAPNRAYLHSRASLILRSNTSVYSPVNADWNLPRTGIRPLQGRGSCRRSWRACSDTGDPSRHDRPPGCTTESWVWCHPHDR